MDPQSANNLDPKLKETYDKVMGTSTQPAGAAPAAPQPVTPAAASPLTGAPIPDPATNPAAPAPVDPAQAAAPAIPQAPNTADNLSFQAAIQTPPAGQAPLGSMLTPKQPSSLLRILYIVGGVVFFVVYAFVWAKIFNLPLPF